MSATPVHELASAIQSVSIKEKPSPEHDILPSTAAEKRVPVDLLGSTEPSELDEEDIDHLDDVDDDDEDDDDFLDRDILKPRPRRKSFPKLPDFRFEQSYLASIKTAKSNSEVIFITVRDQVLQPLAQGVLWNMVIFGWRYWNRGSKFAGHSLGARVRKWWWGFNNWKLPPEATAGAGSVAGLSKEKLAKSAEDVSLLRRWQRDVSKWTAKAYSPTG